MRLELKWGPSHRVAIEKYYSLCDILDLHDALDYEADVQKALMKKNEVKQ